MTSGTVELRIMPDAAAAGREAAGRAVELGLKARLEGRRAAYWLMAAPSAFEFYKAFIQLAGNNPETAAMARGALWFQFDDYPVARNSPEFPVTFRHLLEQRFFTPLADAIGTLPEGIRYLELTGSDEGDSDVCRAYAGDITAVAADPGTCLIQVKGIGMDGHWGFHGSETPLEAPASLVRVPVNAANRRQQMLDWPRFFPREEDVPAYAVTSTVALFLKADHIIDIVPQPQKEFAVAACYGDGRVYPELPSSALKQHPDAVSYLTADSARALLELKDRRSASPSAGLSASTIRRLESWWETEGHPELTRRAVEEMHRILGITGMLGD